MIDPAECAGSERQEGPRRTATRRTITGTRTLRHARRSCADRGILSIKERFDQAAREDPTALSPVVLYPIIHATAVKRTRQFVKKHYGGDTMLPDGRTATTVFPTPQAITVRYNKGHVVSTRFLRELASR